MERVAFLVERTGERIPCLLNPNNVVCRRWAGVRPVEAAGHRLTGTELSDYPLLFSGGGRTEYELDLLFDTSLLPTAASSVQAGPNRPGGTDRIDVRTLTGPLWRLAENSAGTGRFGAPQLARFVWGKSWNVLCAIVAIAERVEQFGVDGTPGRSWLRLRMVRVAEEPAVGQQPAPPPAVLDDATTGTVQATDATAGAEPVFHEVLGDGGPSPRGERLDEIAARYYPGRPWMWRYLATTNGLDDAPWSPPGAVLEIPPTPDLSGSVASGTRSHTARAEGAP